MLKRFLPQIIASLFLVGFVAYAWTGPSSPPPNENAPAPINVGSSSQTFLDSKTLRVKSDGSGVINLEGGLGVGGVLRGYADAIFDGKVGIGTTNPQGKLDLFGSLAIGGNQGTAGQILQSQGPSLTPTWITAPKYYEFDYIISPPFVSCSPTSGAHWQDWDLSAQIPDGATAAVIMFTPANTTSPALGGARKNGSSVNIGSQYSSTRIIQLDSSRIAEIYVDQRPNPLQCGSYFCLGYWK